MSDVHLVSDRETGRPRGFGFVTMGTPEEAKKAIEGMDGQMLSLASGSRCNDLVSKGRALILGDQAGACGATSSQKHKSTAIGHHVDHNVRFGDEELAYA